MYDDEPRNMKELLTHPEKDEIKKGDTEIQQLIDQKIARVLRFNNTLIKRSQ